MDCYVKSPKIALFGDRDIIGYAKDGFMIKELDRRIANELIIKNHYSHKIYNATYINLGIYIDNVLLGVIQLGYALNPASYKNLVGNTNQNEYLELNRMWLDDLAPKNSESRALSYVIKYLKKKYNNRYKWIQSFADERCGKNGVVYQASNFKYYGEHNSDFYELEDVMYHSIQMTVKDAKRANSPVVKYLQDNKDKAVKHTLRQFRYIYYIDKKYIEFCKLKEKPYPKHYLE